MKQEEFNNIASGMEEAYNKAMEYKKNKAPKCHMTSMVFDECDTESWWECKHCGHTKLIDTFPIY